jgi:multidrug efflux pump
VLYACGYSLNILTLLALVLAIGMVVDDAIVVLENVHRRIKEGETPMVAAARGSSQVLLAVLATTAVLLAVFLPILLWEGKAGKMFTEFAVAMSAAVCFSSLVALTLTPLLCSRLLKSHEEVSLVGMGVDWVMSRLERGYRAFLGLITRLKIVTTLVFATLCLLVVWGWKLIPTEFEPVEDRGFYFVMLQAPEGTGFYAMNKLVDQFIPASMAAFEDHELKWGLLLLPGHFGSDGSCEYGASHPRLYALARALAHQYRGLEPDASAAREDPRCARPALLADRHQHARHARAVRHRRTGLQGAAGLA